MTNNFLQSYVLGVLIDDVWLSGVQSVSINRDKSINKVRDIGRVQSRLNVESPRKTTEIIITRNIGDVAPPFYVPGDLSNYNSTFLLSNSNIGLSGWDSIKEFKFQLVFGNEGESYLGETSANYLHMDQASYCVLSRISYSISTTGFLIEEIALLTNTIDKMGSGAYSSLALPSFPESANLINRGDLDLTNSVFPNQVATILDNGWNAAFGKDSSHGKYLIQSLDFSCEIEYSELTDYGKPRGSDTASEQNLYRFVSNVNVSCGITGLGRKSTEIDDIVSDVQDMTTVYQPDEQIKLVFNNGTNYTVFDLGSANFISAIDEGYAEAQSGLTEYTLQYFNNRCDFVPYVSNTVLTLTQSGTI